MQKISKNKGITLVSLIVTIIILMILAGVVIATVNGNNGILGKAKQARDTYQNSAKDEKTEIAKTTNELNKYINGNREIEEKYITDEDLKNWINKLDNTSINLKDITNNELLARLMNSKEAVDYMCTNSNIMDAVVGSKYSMELLGNSEYASFKIATNNALMSKIRSSDYFDYFGKKIAKQTNNTNIIYSRIEMSNRDAYLAFDDDIYTGWSACGENAANDSDYIGYNFGTKKIVYKCTMDSKFYTGGYDDYRWMITSFILQGSNDKVTWNNIKQCDMQKKSPNVFDIDNTEGYIYYRCKFNGAKCSYCSSLQFYYVDYLENP